MDTSYIQLKQFIISSKEILSVKDIKEVEHYFNHSEYEMAFEGLLIELTKLGKYPKEFNFSEWRDLENIFNLIKIQFLMNLFGLSS